MMHIPMWKIPSVKVDVFETVLQGDYGLVEGLEVRCTLCGTEVEVYGRSPRSMRRGCMMLKEQCPNQQRWRRENYYSPLSPEQEADGEEWDEDDAKYGEPYSEYEGTRPLDEAI